MGPMRERGQVIQGPYPWSWMEDAIHSLGPQMPSTVVVRAFGHRTPRQSSDVQKERRAWAVVPPPPPLLLLEVCAVRVEGLRTARGLSHNAPISSSSLQ